MSILILQLIGLYVSNNVTDFGSFGVEHIPKEIKAFIDRYLYITKNIFKTRAYDPIMSIFLYWIY